MTNVVIKNLNTNINRRLRFVGVDGATINIGIQSGAVVLYGSDLRVCLSPFEGLSCSGSTTSTSVAEFIGTFDVEIDGTKYTNLTPAEMQVLMASSNIPVEAIIDPTPYNITVEYV